MLLDKYCHMPFLRKISWFSLFGVVNAACYGLSHMMSEDDYVYYFGYKGQGRYTDAVRSLFGSNNLVNAAWTVPSLIFVGGYMHSKVGYLIMGKFTALSLFGTVAFMTAFNPTSDYSLIPNFRVLGNSLPVKWDCNGYHSKFGPYYMGADSLAGSIWYFALFYNKMWTVSLALMAFDMCYYGPQFMGGPLAAMFGAMTLL